MRLVAIAAIAIIALIATTFSPLPTQAVTPDIKRLDKATAAKIIASMGYDDVYVGAVIHGIGEIRMGAFSNDSVAFVLAVGNRDGKSKKIRETLFYDAERGWLYFEYQEKAGKQVLCLWTSSGFTGIKPAPSTK